MTRARPRVAALASSLAAALVLLPAAGARAQAPAPVASVGDVVHAEGAAGTTTAFEFTITLDQPAAGDVTVDYEALDGDAAALPSDPAAPARLADADFAPASGTATILDGETSTTVTVTVNGDDRVEPDERFGLLLTTPVNATLGQDTGTGIITNDDTFPVAAQPAAVSLPEGAAGTTDAVFTVALSHPYPEPVTIRARTVDGTAVAGADYTAQDGRITIPAGTASVTVSVPVAGDATVEPDETFVLELSAPENATLAGDAAALSATGTITNDDTANTGGGGGGAVASVISVSAPRVAEGASGLQSMTFVLTVTPAPVTATAVNFATRFGSAAPGTDYVAQSGTVTFAAGQTTKQVVVAIVGDTLLEADETLGLVLSMPSATATLADPGYGIGTIANDDVKAAGVCRVPKVKGLTLTTAKARLTAAGCRIATTRRRASATVRKGRALGTSAKAGTLVPAGTKVAVVLSTGTSAT